MAVVTTRKAQGLPLAIFVSKAVLDNRPICLIPVQSQLCFAFDIPVLLQHVTATVHCVTVAMKLCLNVADQGNVPEHFVTIWKSDFKLNYWLLFIIYMEMQQTFIAEISAVY